jgi:hypothetical protein
VKLVGTSEIANRSIRLLPISESELKTGSPEPEKTAGDKVIVAYETDFRDLAAYGSFAL